MQKTGGWIGSRDQNMKSIEFGNMGGNISEEGGVGSRMEKRSTALDDGNHQEINDDLHSRQLVVYGRETRRGNFVEVARVYTYNNDGTSVPAFGRSTNSVWFTPSYRKTSVPPWKHSNPLGSIFPNGETPATTLEGGRSYFVSAPSPTDGGTFHSRGSTSFSQTPAVNTSSSPGFGFGCTTSSQATTQFGTSSNLFGSGTYSGGIHVPYAGDQFKTPSSGGSTSESFTFSVNRGGTRATPYTETIEVEGNFQLSTRIKSTSVMPVFRDKCHEALRWEDKQLGDNVAKKLILAGVKSVMLHDEGIVGLWVLFGNSNFIENDIGKIRALAFVQNLQELNNAVIVTTLTKKLTKERLFDFQFVVFTDTKVETAIEFSDYCHNHQPSIAFIKAKVRGIFGNEFCDFGPEFTMIDIDGEEPHTYITASNNNDTFALVLCVDDEGLKLQDGDLVMFSGDCGIHDFKVINSNQFLMSSNTHTRFASVIFATETNDFCITRERIMLYCEEFVKRKHCNATGEASFKQEIEKMYLESQNVEMFEGKREVHLGSKENLEAEIIIQRSFNELCQVLRNMIILVEVFKCSLTYRTLEDLNTLPICDAITCTSMISEFANHLLVLYIRSKKKKRDDRLVVNWYCNFIFAAKAAIYKHLPSILRFRLLNHNQPPRIEIIVSMFKKDQDTKDYGRRRHLKTEWNLLQVFQIYILVHMDVLKKWRPTKLFYIVHEHGESFDILVISMLDLVMQLAEKEVENANLILTSSIKCMLVNCEDWNYKLKIIPYKLMMLILIGEYTLSRKLEVCVARRLINTTSMTPHLEKKIESGLDYYVDLQAQKATSKPKLQAYQRVVKLGTRLSESDRKRNRLTGSYFLVSILDDKDVLKGKDMSQTKLNDKVWSDALIGLIILLGFWFYFGPIIVFSTALLPI